MIVKEENIKIQPKPSPNQIWAHSTCSQYNLSLALLNPSVTAIESDIVMGTIGISVDSICNYNSTSKVEPIMAHPPCLISDLSVKDFLIRTKHTKKLLKLDFKCYETLIPTFDLLQDITNKDKYNVGRTIFLNADILQGPGQRHEQPTIDADVFIQTCFKSIMKNRCYTTSSKNEVGNFVFSLGWRVDCRSLFGYTKDDVMKMKELVIRHQILERTGLVVFSLNARVLSKNINVIDWYIYEVQQKLSSSSYYEKAPIQLLIWTATGEPPISKSLYANIKYHYEKCGMSHLVGYDCKVANAFLSGLFYDNILIIVSIIWNLKNTCFLFFYRIYSVLFHSSKNSIE